MCGMQTLGHCDRIKQAFIYKSAHRHLTLCELKIEVTTTTTTTTTTTVLWSLDCP